MRLLILTGLALCVVVCASSTYADPYAVDGLGVGQQPPQGMYPVTELRPVRRPGDYHYVQTSQGKYVLTDMWWEEVPTRQRNFTDGQPISKQQAYRRALPPVYLELEVNGNGNHDDEDHVPDRGGTGVAPGSIGYDDGRVTQYGAAVYVKVVDGEVLRGDKELDIEDASFYILEGERRRVRLQLDDDSFTELVASYDGYGVDLGAADVARVAPGLQGRRQRLGDAPGIEDLEVILLWNSNAPTQNSTSGQTVPGREPQQDADEPVVHRRVIKYRSQ